MRMHARLALSAIALVSLTAGAARAADKVRLERMDLKGSPTLKLYLTFVDAEGRAVTGKAKEDFRIVVDSAEQGSATAAQTFDESKEPINLVVVAQIGSAMQGVIDSEKSAIGA